jgi:hypothetical protein
MSGRHTYTSYTKSEDEPFVKRNRAFMSNDFSALDTDEKLTADQFKQAHQLAQREAERLAGIDVSKENADIFLAAHPEYVDHDKNGHEMERQLAAMFGDSGPRTVGNYELAYQELRKRNLLELDGAEVAKQRDRENISKHKAWAKANTLPSEEEMYKMPLNELYDRAMGRK